MRIGRARRSPLRADISWLNDIAIGRFGNATEALVGEATKEQDLAQKKVRASSCSTSALSLTPLLRPSQLMLSLGKLSQVAQANKQTLQSEQVQRAIEGELHGSSDATLAPADPPFRFVVVDDRIDMVNSQELLFEIFSGVLSGSESRTSLEEQSQIIASRVAPILADRPAFAHVRCRG